MAPSLLAGLAKGLYGGDTGPSTAHGQFVHSTVLPLLTKLQRELRSRKHKVRRYRVVSYRIDGLMDGLTVVDGFSTCHMARG